MWTSPQVVAEDRRLAAATTIKRVAEEISGRPIPRASFLHRWVSNLRSHPRLTPSRTDEWALMAAYADLVLAIRLADALTVISSERGRCYVSPTIFRNQLYRRQEEDMPKGHAELHIGASLLQADPRNHVEVRALDQTGAGCDVWVESPDGRLNIEVQCRQFISGLETNAAGLTAWFRRSTGKKAAKFPRDADGRRIVALDVACHRAVAAVAIEEAPQEIAADMKKLERHDLSGVLLSIVQLDPSMRECGFVLAHRFLAVSDQEAEDPGWCGLAALVL